MFPKLTEKNTKMKLSKVYVTLVKEQNQNRYLRNTVTPAVSSPNPMLYAV